MILALCLCALVAVAHAATFHKVQEPVEDSYIATFSPRASSAAAKAVANKYDGSTYIEIGEFRALLVRLPSGSRLHELLDEDEIDAVHQDAVVRIATTQLNPPSWGLDRIDQPELPLSGSYKYPADAGQGQKVYVLDTGINVAHEDFGGRAVWGTSFITNQNSDGHGHGTHCAGTIAGTKYGVAKKAQVIAVKVLDDSGNGSGESIINGINWVAQQCGSAGNYQICTISMSLGGRFYQPFNDALTAAIRLGIVAVVAAGNDNRDACSYSPASTPTAITVGATDDADGRASFSNYGTCVDIFAPGVEITSTWIGSSSATATLDGTSMATPHVAGAVAVLKSSYGLAYASPDAIRTALLKQAVPVVKYAGTGSPNLLLRVRPVLYVCSDAIPPGEASTEIRVVESGNYANNQACTWLVHTSLPGGRVRAAFNWFSTEWSYDFVQIYDGTSTSALALLPNIGYWTTSWGSSGSATPPVVSSSGADLFVRFASDWSVTSTGLSLAVTEFSELECGATLPQIGFATGQASFIRLKPSLYGGYPNNAYCLWQTKVRSGCTIKAEFEALDIENFFDFVKIYDGASDANTQLVSATGRSVPSPVTTTGTDITVKFTSDFSITFSGFSLKLSPVCGSGQAASGEDHSANGHLDEGPKIGVGIGVGFFVVLALVGYELGQMVRHRRERGVAPAVAL